MYNYLTLSSQHETFVYHLESRLRLQDKSHSVSEFKHPCGKGQEYNQTDQNKASEFCEQNTFGSISLVLIQPEEYAKLGYWSI